MSAALDKTLKLGKKLTCDLYFGVGKVPLISCGIRAKLVGGLAHFQLRPGPDFQLALLEMNHEDRKTTLRWMRLELPPSRSRVKALTTRN